MWAFHNWVEIPLLSANRLNAWFLNQIYCIGLGRFFLSPPTMYFTVFTYYAIVIYINSSWIKIALDYGLYLAISSSNFDNWSREYIIKSVSQKVHPLSLYVFFLSCSHCWLFRRYFLGRSAFFIICRKSKQWFSLSGCNNFDQYRTWGNVWSYTWFRPKGNTAVLLFRLTGIYIPCLLPIKLNCIAK